MTRLQIAALGPPEVRLEGRPLTGLASSRVRALLYYLAVDRNHAVGHTHVRAYPDGTAIRFEPFGLWEGGD